MVLQSYVRSGYIANGADLPPYTTIIWSQEWVGKNVHEAYVGGSQSEAREFSTHHQPHSTAGSARAEITM